MPSRNGNNSHTRLRSNEQATHSQRGTHKAKIPRASPPQEKKKDDTIEAMRTVIDEQLPGLKNASFEILPVIVHDCYVPGQKKKKEQEPEDIETGEFEDTLGEDDIVLSCEADETESESNDSDSDSEEAWEEERKRVAAEGHTYQMVRELPAGVRIIKDDLVGVWRDEEGNCHVAVTIIYDHEKLAQIKEDSKEAILGLRNHHLKQRRHTLEEDSTFVGGLGYRRGYEKGKTHGLYKRKKGSNDAEYKPLHKKMVNLVLGLEGVAKKCLPESLKDRERIIKWYSLDAISKRSPHIIFSINYCCALHKDRDICFALGCWLVAHGLNCNCQDGHIPGWYFYFPELQAAVELRDGVVIMWNSRRFGHATVFPDKETRGQDACSALCAVTQIQQQYAQAMFNMHQRDLAAEDKQTKKK